MERPRGDTLEKKAHIFYKESLYLRALHLSAAHIDLRQSAITLAHTYYVYGYLQCRNLIYGAPPIAIILFSFAKACLLDG
jgi:hypothetical protein